MGRSGAFHGGWSRVRAEIAAAVKSVMLREAHGNGRDANIPAGRIPTLEEVYLEFARRRRRLD
ncbi:hypothetical protein [Paenibacillus sp. GCM10027626]|uniref:hypothetical protein n=1 Tax=Paenibacillus sp. GCM10027626 TaxID=3273411 RepID=UPI00363463DA